MEEPGVSSWVMWQLVDSAFPAGGLNHSQGLEAAMQASLVVFWLKACTRSIFLIPVPPLPPLLSSFSLCHISLATLIISSVCLLLSLFSISLLVHLFCVQRRACLHFRVSVCA